jgi:hypothetical protein
MVIITGAGIVVKPGLRIVIQGIVDYQVELLRVMGRLKMVSKVGTADAKALFKSVLIIVRMLDVPVKIGRAQNKG